MHHPKKEPVDKSRGTNTETDMAGAPPRQCRQKTGIRNEFKSLLHDLMHVPGSSEHMLIL
jgi:hypothetical protein